MVFEQNELMGLLKEGVPLTIFSCRHVDAQKELNDFARPLLPFTEYLNLQTALAGLASCLWQHPFGLARIALLTVRGCLNPLMAPKVIGAFLCAMQLHHTASGRITWIHADFGGNTATVAMFLSLLTGLPFSYKVHAYDIYSRSWQVLDPLRCVKAKASHIILSEHDDGKKAYCAVSGEAPDKVLVHYSCVRTDVFHSVPDSKIEVDFLALGRLVKKKGFDQLIRAIGLLKSEGIVVRVSIRGYGPEKASLEALIDELKLNDFVTIDGAYDNDQLISIFSKAGALVAPCVIDETGDRDGVPTVIYEAMACAVPVIATSVGGIAEVVHDGVNGLLIGAGNIDELATAMKLLMFDPVKRRQFGEQARREMIQNYDYRDAARKMLTVFGNEPNQFDIANKAAV
jgi:glycosyltransferase involved in cell wall biosynthesis